MHELCERSKGVPQCSLDASYAIRGSVGANIQSGAVRPTFAENLSGIREGINVEAVIELGAQPESGGAMPKKPGKVRETFEIEILLGAYEHTPLLFVARHVDKFKVGERVLVTVERLPRGKKERK